MSKTWFLPYQKSFIASLPTFAAREMTLTVGPVIGLVRRTEMYQMATHPYPTQIIERFHGLVVVICNMGFFLHVIVCYLTSSKLLPLWLCSWNLHHTEISMGFIVICFGKLSNSLSCMPFCPASDSQLRSDTVRVLRAGHSWERRRPYCLKEDSCQSSLHKF